MKSKSFGRETPILRDCSMSENGSFPSKSFGRETPILWDCSMSENGSFPSESFGRETLILRDCSMSEDGSFPLKSFGWESSIRKLLLEIYYSIMLAKENNVRMRLLNVESPKIMSTMGVFQWKIFGRETPITGNFHCKSSIVNYTHDTSLY